MELSGQLGPYEVLERLGSGGMGAVYKARDTRLGRLVAIKVLRQDQTSDAERDRRFLQEARAASALTHPHIVTVHDVGADRGIAYMVMELVEGKPLDQIIPSQGLRLPELLRIATPIADAFACAHAAGIVHRDLKPSNVMLSSNGAVKVLDFGLAKLAQQSTPAPGGETLTAGNPVHTVHGTIMGTPGYMSPEQAEGKTTDLRSDIFSFGVLLYEMATGRRAFSGSTSAAIMAAVIAQEPAPVSTVRPDLPAAFTQLLTRCLRKNPERRPQSMADVRVLLEDLAAETPTPVPAAPVAAVRPGRPPRAVMAAALVVLLLAAALLWRARSTSPAAPSGGASLDPVALTDYPGAETLPTLSPDGNQVAFVWAGPNNDNRDIYVKVVGAGEPLRLTTDPVPDLRPMWSPDGRSIAFFRVYAEQLFFVYVIPALGGLEKKFGPFVMPRIPIEAFTPVGWARDSRSLYLAASEKVDKPSSIHRLSLENGEVTLLLQSNQASGSYAAPVVSPEGRHLYVTVGNTSLQLASAPLNDSGEPTGPPQTIPGARNLGYFALSPDGRYAVFSYNSAVHRGLYRLPTSGGTAEALPWTGPGAQSPSISANGRLAFSRDTRDTNLWRLSLDSASSGLEPVAPSSFREVAPHYSPDGRRLTFFSNRSGSLQIWTSEATGAHPAQLTFFADDGVTGSPQWSPDGRSIAFDSNTGSSSFHLFVAPADGGKPRQLTFGDSTNVVAAWSPDGRWIYFSSNRTGESRIWRVAAAGGEPEQVAPTRAEAPTISPDGAWLYFLRDIGRGGLWRMPIAGGPETRIAESVFRHSVAVTARGVYYCTWPGPAGLSSIRWIDPATGSSREIYAPPKPIDLGLAVSPDHRHLIFAQSDYRVADLMFVERF